MKEKIYYFFVRCVCVFGVCCTMTAFAQNFDFLDDKGFVIKSKINLILKDNAFKISTTPNFFTTQLEKPSIHLVKHSYPFFLLDTYDTLEPITIKLNNTEEYIHSLFVDASLGTRLNSEFKLSYSSKQNALWNYHFFYDYIGYQLPIKNYKWAVSSEHRLGSDMVFLSIPHHRVNAKVLYDREQFNFYNTVTEFLDDDPLEQVFDVVNISLNLLPVVTSVPNYVFDVDYILLNTLSDITEHRIRFKYDFHIKDVSLYSSSLNIRGVFDNNNNSVISEGGESVQNNLIFLLNPVLINHRLVKHMIFTAGFKLVNLFPSNSDGDIHTFMYPDIVLKYTDPYHFVRTRVRIYGDYIRNSFRSLSLTNRYLTNGITLRNTSVYGFDWQGDVSLSRTLDVSSSLKYEIKQDMPFYRLIVNNAINTYRVEYHGLHVFTASADIMYKKNDKLTTQLHAEYNIYQTEDSILPWYMPDYEIQLLFKYRVNKNILARLDAIVIGSRYAEGFEHEGQIFVDRKLSPSFDLNIGCSYKYSQRLSIDIDIYNILNQRYFIYNHPVQGFMFTAGVSYQLF